MRVKLYRATEIAAAMARIRVELGPDALILSTRKIAEGVEVTAALETAAPIPPEAADPDRAGLLAWHGIPPRLAAALGTGRLEATLAAALRFASLPLDPAAPPLLLIGPPGAGKTLTIARLATRLVLAGAAPRIVTADGERAGAVEQLAAFTRLLDLDLLAAATPEALGRAMDRARGGAASGPVLIDTPGLHPFAPAARAALAALIGAAGGTVALVLPGGMDPAESADLAAGCAEAGATHLIATRLDLARRLGGVLAAADAGGLALAEAGIGPGAADGLAALTPALLARLLERARPSASPAHPDPMPHGPTRPGPPRPGPPRPGPPHPGPPHHGPPGTPDLARAAPAPDPRPNGHRIAPPPPPPGPPPPPPAVRATPLPRPVWPKHDPAPRPAPPGTRA